jgi:hypothetical protein
MADGRTVSLNLLMVHPVGRLLLFGGLTKTNQAKCFALCPTLSILKGDGMSGGDASWLN